ncbi:serine/threonine-protein kinase Nek6-like [Montipora foliosa]|uniref:serine/threonine-protein kinase Nek6-like n=1 Tax=Montipora foliosa TaxID=591990 RepID=UPI0035F1D5B6
MAVRTRLQDQSTDNERFNILTPDSVFAALDHQPGTLQQHCRTFILQAMGLKRLARIVDLPIPKPMVNFLANQLSVDDFFVNRNNLNSNHIAHCVYPAKCLLDMSEVLLKCVPPCLADDRVTSMMEAWKDVSHPNIMDRLVQFNQGGTEIIVYEYPPVPLTDILAEQRSLSRLLPEYLIWKALSEVCSAVKYLNEKGIIYETSNPPERISFDENGLLKLDSGLLYIPSAQDGMNAMAMGDSNTGIYTPPEVLTGQQFRTASQVWLLGCVLYEFATLEPAYQVQGTDMFTALANIMEGRPPPAISDSFSRELKSTIVECLKGNPDQRPKVEELANRATVIMDRMKEGYEGRQIVDL